VHITAFTSPNSGLVTDYVPFAFVSVTPLHSASVHAVNPLVCRVYRRAGGVLTKSTGHEPH